MSEDNMLRDGDFIIIAIPYKDDEPCNVEIAFTDIVSSGDYAWISHLAELRGIERKDSLRV